MCGIVGAIARRDVTPILIEGLTRLEYRGYDSAGIAVLADEKNAEIRRVRRVGRVSETDMKVVDNLVRGDKILNVRIIEGGLAPTVGRSQT